MSIAQAQAMRKAREDIEALKARLDALEACVAAIVSRGTIVSDSMATPPKKRGRPPKA
jgi:BMFP domain-containing protein YqiC